MKERDILGVKTYSNLSDIFSGVKTPQPPELRPAYVYATLVHHLNQCYFRCSKLCGGHTHYEQHSRAYYNVNICAETSDLSGADSIIAALFATRARACIVHEQNIPRLQLRSASC